MDNNSNAATAQDTIYLCNFRVSVDGDWLCLREVDDVEVQAANNRREDSEQHYPELRTPSPIDTHFLMPRDPVIIERRNLVNISKLIVKELLDTSTKYGRMLDSDHMTLQHFFIVLEHVLRHGLRPKKGLLGPKKELWDILQLVEKLTPEANDITSSVRNLPTVKTHMGRARAWLRVALMQKKLADYLKVLVDHKDDVLVDYFEPDALMMSEEAIVIIGLLVGLNVIDCNLCVKEEDLDCELGVIDFSLYLRSNHYNNNNNNNNNGSPNSADSEFENMTTVLDQKNYIEELNRHLNATVANLQSKVEELTTSNALMKEDLDISRENILALMQENAFLKARQCTIQNWQRLNGEDKLSVNNAEDKDSTVTNDDDDTDVEQLKQQLMAEAKLRREAEKQLNIQVCIKAEMEVAMKFLEKDIHEKQDIIVSLRKQLEDIKIINLEMYKKLQECENSLKHKTEFIAQLENKTGVMADSMKKLQRKYEVLERDKVNIMESYVKEKEQTVSNLEKIASVEGELKVERDWRESLESSLISEKERISSLLQETAQLKTMASKYLTLQEDHLKLQEECREQEKALEELGVHLSISKLQVSDLKEEVCIKKSNSVEGQWTSDKEVTHCKSCSKEFNLTRRKHHCRNCGNIFCHQCSDNTMALASSAKPVRVCDECHHTLLAKFSVVS